MEIPTEVKAVRLRPRWGFLLILVRYRIDFYAYMVYGASMYEDDNEDPRPTPKRPEYVTKDDVKWWVIGALILGFFAFVTYYGVSHYSSGNTGGSASCQSSDFGC